MNLKRLQVQDNETGDVSRLLKVVMNADEIVKEVIQSFDYDDSSSLSFIKDFSEVFEDLYLAINNPNTWKFTYKLQQLQ